MRKLQVFSKLLEKLNEYMERQVGEYQETYVTMSYTISSKVYDSVIRIKLFKSLQQMRLPTKLISLVKACLKDSKTKVKVHNQTSDEFVVTEVSVNPGGCIFNKMCKVLVYADANRDG